MPGESIYYEPKMRVYHLVRAEKMSMRRTMRKRFAAGRYAYLALGDDTQQPSIGQILAKFVERSAALLPDSSAGVVFRDHKRYPFLQNYLYEQTFNHLVSLGFIFEQLKRL